MNKRTLLLFLFIGIILTKFSIANTGEHLNETDEVYFEFVDEKEENKDLESTYHIEDKEIKQDKYTIIANNMGQLDEDYIISDKIFDMNINDKFEPFNRRVYALNTTLDKNILYPASRVYSVVVPKPVREGINNFANNFSEIPTFINSVLQFKFAKAGNALGRFAINSIFGIAGINDVATKIGIKRDKETMGDTLGTYGIGYGTYLVTPIFGPSNLRDGIGMIIDTGIEGISQKVIFENPLLYANGVKEAIYVPARATMTGFNLRSLIDFRYGDFNSPFEYDLIKMFYINFRKIQIRK